MGKTPMVYPVLRFFIDGRWIDAGAGEGSDVVDPATEEVIARLPHAGAETVNEALAAAARGLEAWRREPAANRRRALLRIAQNIAARKNAMAEALSREQGKTRLEAGLEIERAVDTFEWFAEEAVRIYGRVYPERNPGVRNSVLPQPVGVVAAFTPWNFPAFLPARKIAPALAAGCSIILKAAEETPGTPVLMMEAIQEADLPPGVVNLVFGVPSRISQQLLASPLVRKISFTGSVAVGKLLARQASENLQRCTLELGGHSPMIVFPDADVTSTVRAAAAFKFRNAGQVCISPNRFYVHREVYHEFVRQFADVANQVKVGNGREDGVTMGPLANRRRLDAMSRLVGDAVEKGARLAAGGRRIGNQGFFWEPTVLADVPDEALVMREEPFGPLAPIAAFSDPEEVLARANGLGYGLAAYVYTRSPVTANLMSDRLEAGTVGINHMSPAHADIPMGGLKDSGYGYEGGHEGLDAYLVHRHIAQALA
jgi:succinate-semialdehyde dehydrogenase / glutarate-semialdehyde dehydrogenase